MVKKLRLSKALILSQGTTVSEACRRMVSRKVDAVLLADAEGFLSGIVTAMVLHFSRHVTITSHSHFYAMSKFRSGFLLCFTD